MFWEGVGWLQGCGWQGDKTYFLADRKFNFLSWLMGGLLDHTGALRGLPHTELPHFTLNVNFLFLFPGFQSYGVLEKNHLVTKLSWNSVDKIVSTSQHILWQTEECLFISQAPTSYPLAYGCILFVNAWGSGSGKTGVSQPHVTGQELCQGEECKQWTKLDSSEPEECSEWQCALQSLTNGMLELLQSRERQKHLGGAPPLAHFTDEKCERGRRKWEGRQAKQGGKEENGERVLFKISCSPPAPTVCR